MKVLNQKVARQPKCSSFFFFFLLLQFCTLIQPISVLLQFFALFMVTSKQHYTRLIAHSSMELKYWY